MVGMTWFFGFLVTGCDWRASWRYLKGWLAVVGGMALIAGVIAGAAFGISLL